MVKVPRTTALSVPKTFMPAAGIAVTSTVSAIEHGKDGCSIRRLVHDDDGQVALLAAFWHTRPIVAGVHAGLSATVNAEGLLLNPPHVDCACGAIQLTRRALLGRTGLVPFAPTPLVNVAFVDRGVTAPRDLVAVALQLLNANRPRRTAEVPRGMLDCDSRRAATGRSGCRDNHHSKKRPPQRHRGQPAYHARAQIRPTPGRLGSPCGGGLPRVAPAGPRGKLWPCSRGGDAPAAFVSYFSWPRSLGLPYASWQSGAAWVSPAPSFAVARVWDGSCLPNATAG